MLFKTIKAAFGQRRKTLANALAAGFPALDRAQIEGAIRACGFEPTIRGEKLDIAGFTALSDELLALMS